MRKRAAFTLIELLVVIAIIAVLVAILVPIIRDAMRDARRSGCMANLKVIGSAFREYDRSVGGFPRQVPSGDPSAALAGPATANPGDTTGGSATLAGVTTNAMDTVAWTLIAKGLLPATAFHCQADRDWTERIADNRFGWTRVTEFSYGVQFPFDDDGTTSAGNGCPANQKYPPNGLLMADIGNDDSGTVVVSLASQYTNHADGIAYLHLAGNVNFHASNPASSVIFANQIYDDDGPPAPDDNVPDSPTDAVILPIR